MRKNKKHPLVRTWTQVGDPDDVTPVTYTISRTNGRFSVRSVDTSDGEILRVTGVNWNGKVLRFTTLCPSTKWKVEHSLRMKRGGLMEHELKYVEIETWMKRNKTSK